jgi:hypothetical protein
MLSIERRKKYLNSGKTVDKSGKIIDINFDLNSLNLMCSYVLSENKNIRRSHLINMRNLFAILNMELYVNDIEKMKRVNFIKKGLEAKLLQNLKDPIIVLKYINGGIIDDDVIDINNFTLLSNDELDWINQTISESLKYAFIFNDIDRMIDICTRFKAANYSSRSAIVSEFEALITEIQSKFRRVKVEASYETTFTLRPGAFEEVVTDIHEQLSNLSRRLVCGMQGVNEMTGGGFESGRVYMLFGGTGVGKSLTLLNLAQQIKKYNKGFRAKDPTKIPAIVILTQENTVRESVERLFNMMIGGQEITNFSSEEVINLLRTEGELYLSDESPIDIIIKYMPDKSIDTGYLYTMTEDLEDEGYEVICLIQDHVKRIRSVYSHPDIRLELGAVVNEFKTYASIKDIPVISNSHLNRDGAKTLDSASQGNKADLTRMLGRANIGESMLMLDNLDGGYIINVEYDSNGNKYMVFSAIKSRVKAGRSYICQPFVNGNGAKLVEDFDSPVPVFKDSLRNGADENTLYKSNNINKKATYNSIKEIDEIFSRNEEKDEINLFATSRYSSVNISEVEETEGFVPVMAGVRSDIDSFEPKVQPLKAVYFVDRQVLVGV